MKRLLSHPISQDERTKIVVVDDARKVLDYLVEVVRSGGYDALAAASGKQALQALAHHGDKVKLAIVDVFMPGMSGTELVVQMCRRQPAMRFVVISGTPMELLPDSELSRLARLPRESFVFALKPFTPEAILNRIRFLLAA
jgi:CheY-like chemotaxis protein